MNAIFTVFQEMTWKGLASQVRHWALALAAGRAGGLMVETVVAVSLMTIVGTAVLSGLSTTHISGAKTERQSIGENIARNQMAQVLSGPYNEYIPTPTPYATVTLPPEYSRYQVTIETISAEAQPENALTPTPVPDPDRQKIKVNVTFEGQTVFELESIKVK